MYHELTITILWYLAGGIACALTSYFVVGWRKPRPSLKHRIEYAILSGIGSFGLIWVVHRFFPEHFLATDSIPCGIITGLAGLQRMFVLVAKRLGLDPDMQILDNRDKKDN